MRSTIERILLLFACLCLGRYVSGVPANPSDKKVAFLFMSRGQMYLENVWHEFFRWHANESHYTIYSHVHKGYTFPRNSFFSGKELPQSSLEAVGRGAEGRLWGNMAQVRAIRALVKEALKDPLNEWFTLMSESCLPLYNLNQVRNALLSHDKSIINACDHMGTKEMEGDTRWRPGLDNIGFKKEWWRKSATWFALQRKHAQVFVDDVAGDEGWEKVPCCDEHFLPSILAKHGFDNETSCTDGFTYVHWGPGYSSHPWTFLPDDISPELFHKARTDPASGFEANTGLNGCSGIEGFCHLMGRKFSPVAKNAILENIDLILGEDDEPYEGDPWDYHQAMFRVNGTDYWMIENGYLRKVPDAQTLKALHHLRIVDADGKDIHTAQLTPMDLTAYPIGEGLPSRKDGELVKAQKGAQVYYLSEGKRRAVPNMDTLFSLEDSQGKKLTLDDLKVLYETDIQQIDIGFDVPDVNNPGASNVHTRQHETFRERRGKHTRNTHALGDQGRDQLHHKAEMKKIQERLVASSAAAAAAKPDTSSGDSTSETLEKWLYQSQASNTADHEGDEGLEEEQFASHQTLTEESSGI